MKMKKNDSAQLDDKGSGTRKRTNENWKIDNIRKLRNQTDKLTEKIIITTVHRYKQVKHACTCTCKTTKHNNNIQTSKHAKQTY